MVQWGGGGARTEGIAVLITKWFQDLLEVEATGLRGGLEMEVKAVVSRESGQSSRAGGEESSSNVVGVQGRVCWVWGARETLKWREQAGREKKLAVMEIQQKLARSKSEK